MSVQSEIDRINGNVASTYTALSEMGATMPAQQNSDNLPGTVLTVPQGGEKTVQTDWNQTDETAPDFLKNKPFGDVETVFFEGDIAFEAGEGAISVSAVPPVGSYVTVNWDGVEYVCQASDFNGASFIGNGVVVGLDPTDEPFAFMFVSTEMTFAVCLEEKTTAKVKLSGTSVNKLDPKFFDTTVVFYLGDDNYLYTDNGFSTRATLADVLTTMKTRSVQFTSDGMTFRGLAHASLVGSSGFGRVALFTSSDSVSVEFYYTAEYTG